MGFESSPERINWSAVRGGARYPKIVGIASRISSYHKLLPVSPYLRFDVFFSGHFRSSDEITSPFRMIKTRPVAQLGLGDVAAGEGRMSVLAF